MRLPHLLGLPLALIAQPAAAQQAPAGEAVVPAPAPGEEVALVADRVSYDSEADVVTASGGVRLTRDGYVLTADEIVWDRRSGEVRTVGQTRTVSPDGAVAYGENIVVTDSLRAGAIENLLLVLDDGSRLAANRGTRGEDGVYRLDYAAYTACAVVDSDGCPKRPSWQLDAVAVTYDPATRTARYDGARLELFGIPVVPLPGLSHRVGGGSRSGLLAPDLGFDSVNGISVSQPYYFRLAPDRDLTVTGTLFTGVAPMASARYRQLTPTGAFEARGFVTYSSRRPAEFLGSDPISRGDARGYLETNGRFNLGRRWSIETSARIVTDRTFLRRYDISRDDRLRSTIAFVRQDENSYLSIDGWAFQTLRPGDDQGLVPFAIPRVDYRRRVPNVAGGLATLRLNSLAIGRTDGQDTQRAFAEARWDLRRVTRMGQLVGLTALLRGDAYHTSGEATTLTEEYRGAGGFQTRGIAAAAADVRWPFVGQAFGGVQTVTPRVQLVVTPGLANARIPNEDSRAVDLEDTNLFALNRFPGEDRWEDDSRVTYGVDYALSRPGLRLDAQVGQSYRLSRQDDLLPPGTGLTDRLSDVVGRTNLRFGDIVQLTHRFRLDKDNLAVRRNEFDATVGTRETYARVGYLRLNRNIPLTFEDLADREEIRVGGRIKVARYWSVFGSAIVDLTDRQEDPLATSDGFEPVRHRLGVAYDDDCLSFGLTWRYDYEDAGDARRGSSFLLRLALRNLGV